jgi:fatty acid desaturase
MTTLQSTENLNQNLNSHSSQTPAPAPVENPTEITRDIAYYRKVITPLLPAHFFERQPVRAAIALGLLIFNISAIVFTLVAVESWALQLLLGALIGFSNAGLAFISHELLHGSVIKSRKMQDFLALFTFLPFLMSPTFWRYWHNKLHHGNTQDVLHDPDCFPNMFIFRRSPFMQRMIKFTPGAKTLVSYTYFMWWFSFQTVWNQINLRFKTNMWKHLDQKRVTMEFGFQVALIIGYLLLLGPSLWIPLALLPFFIQNYTLMSYISTNHNLSPLTKINDPLENSLSVSNHPLLEKLHFNFGYHVEHHIFPTMSGAFTKDVHQKLKEVFPETYQCMPKWEALQMLYKTSRVYKNPTTLIHPGTGETWPVLQPKQN